MVTIVSAFVAGVVGGGIGAGLVGWRLLRDVRSDDAMEELIDPDLDRRINQAAQQWAVSHGQEAAAPLVARKLRLAYVIGRGRQRRRQRRSSW